MAQCNKCGKTQDQVNGWLERINETGVQGIFECRPACDTVISSDAAMLGAITGKEPVIVSNRVAYQILGDITCVCTARKKRGMSHCQNCYFSLPRKMQNDLYSETEYAQMYSNSINYLLEHTERYIDKERLKD